MADTMGGDETRPEMKPVLVEFEGVSRIGFETERSVDGQIVVVFLPGSPDPWAGKTVLLKSDDIKPLNVDFGTAVACCEQLGRGSVSLLGNADDA